MDFSLNESQEMLKKAARDFLSQECTEAFVREMEESEDGFSPDFWKKMANLGWLGLVFPEKYGGSGSSFLDLTVLCDEMGRAMCPSPFLFTVAFCGLTILGAGSEEQKANILSKIVKGNLIMALAMTEPESSWNGNAWDPEGIQMRATASSDDYILNGTKLFVYDASVANSFLCVARTRGGANQDRGITLFLVDAKVPGMSITPLRTTAGDKQFEVAFNKVKVSKSSIVGKLNGGWLPLSHVIQEAAVLACAEMVGIGQKMLELTVDYAKTRVQFELPIGINQYVQEFCVNLLSEVDGSRWTTYQAAWKISEGMPHDMEVAIAKAWTSDSIERGCWEGHQVHAGVGYTIDAGLPPLLSRRAKALQIMFGDSSYWLKKVANEMDKWAAPEKPAGKKLGIFNIPEEDQVPNWEPWRARWDAIQKRKEARKKNKAAVK